MRINLPVSGQEYPFPSGHTLVSTTDTKGRILYCNPMFIEVSGYSREELLGQPHNIVRHPDMPEEAYRDMWQTIAAGRPWSAPVKNRRKNGDYYWVMANATPLLENGRPIGYMSVRTEATREQIAAAERLYATMRTEKESGRCMHQLSSGRPIRRTLGGREHEMLRLGLSAKLMLASFANIGMGYLLGHFLSKSLGLGLLALVILFAWNLKVGLVARPLTALIATANRLAAGDLAQTMECNRSDELGELQQALNQLSVNLCSIVRDARDQSSSMVLGTTEIAQGNHNL